MTKTELSTSTFKNEKHRKIGKVEVGDGHIHTLRTREIFKKFLPIERFVNDCHRPPLFSRKVVSMREKSIEEKLIDAVKAKGGVCWKFTSPGTSGVPDRIVLMPSGRIGFVEVKAAGKTPRPLQRLRIRTLRRLGFKAFVLDSPDQIGGIIDAIQTP